MSSGSMQYDQEHENLIEQIKAMEERLELLERHALTSQDIQANKMALGNPKVGNLIGGQFASHGHIYNQHLAAGDLIGQYLGLPGLRVFYPFTAAERDSTATQIKDLANGLDMQQAGCQMGWVDQVEGDWPIPVLNFRAASSDRAYRLDDPILQVSGGESNLISFSRGLTAGVWVNFLDFGAANECLFGQWDSTNQKQWMIYANNSSQIGSLISSDGSTNTTRYITPGINSSEWHFLCLQWSPSAQYDILRIWVDDVYTELASTVAALHNSTANLGLGHNYGSGTPQNFFEGQLAMAFMCGCNISADAITRLYNQTRMFFRPADFHG